MAEPKSYEDLDIYKMAVQLGIAIHEMSLRLPKFELYEEGSQVRRSSKAVAAAIVEGFGRRRYKAEYIRYLIFAISEVDETKLHLDFLFKTNSLTDHLIYNSLRQECELLSRKINRFIVWVETNL